MQGYIDIINDYGNLKIVHIKGADNILPDRISRLYPPIDEDKEREEENDKLIRKLQKAILIKRYHESSDKPNNRKQTQYIKRKRTYHGSL